MAEECLRDGDAWGTVLAEAAAMIGQIMIREPDVDGLHQLAARCADLDAGALAAWAQAYAACVSAAPHEPAHTAATSYAVPVAAPNAIAATAPDPVATVATPGTIALALVATARRRGSAHSHAAARAAAIAVGLPADHVDALLGYRPAEHLLTERPKAPIRVSCFGGFSMMLPGRVLDWAEIKPRTRMALRLLAMHGGRPVHREALMAALWPDMIQLRHEKSARRPVEPSDVSRPGRVAWTLHADRPYRRCIQTRASPRWRTRRRFIYRRPGGDPKSTTRWRSHRNASRTAPGSRTVYGGLLPEDGSTEWVAAIRESYRQQAAAAAEQVSVVELDGGDAAAGLAAAERCLTIDVYRDQAWRLVVSAQRRLGNHAAADRAARDYAAMLASLGLDPSGEPLTTSTTGVATAGRRTRPP